MNKTIRYCLYGLATTVCIVAIFLGVYDQFFKRQVDSEDVNILGAINTVEQSEVKDSFKDLFTNQFFKAGYNDSTITKTDASKELVYTFVTSNDVTATIKSNVEGKYDITAYIPIININNDVVNAYNTNTQNVFVSKINDIMTNSKTYTVCTISYTSYITNNILSVAIMASLKEGTSAQRVIVQTYNYNLSTGKDVTISDILTLRELDKAAVNKKINSVVTKAANDAKSMSDSGYNVYQREVTSDLYDVSSVTNFIQGPNGELYIIYAYGNTSFTSEMDVIEI